MARHSPDVWFSVCHHCYWSFCYVERHIAAMTFFLNFGRIHVKFTKPFLSVQFSGINYICIVVQPTCRTLLILFILQNQNSILPIPLSPSSWQLPFYFLSLCICLFKVWLLSLSIMFSKFIPVVAGMEISFLFKAE